MGLKGDLRAGKGREAKRELKGFDSCLPVRESALKAASRAAFAPLCQRGDPAFNDEAPVALATRDTSCGEAPFPFQPA